MLAILERIISAINATDDDSEADQHFRLVNSAWWQDGKDFARRWLIYLFGLFIKISGIENVHFVSFGCPTGRYTTNPGLIKEVVAFVKDQPPIADVRKLQLNSYLQIINVWIDTTILLTENLCSKN